MTRLTRHIGVALALGLGSMGSMGCELIASVDRSQIPEGAGGSGGSGGAGGQGGTGGVAPTCGDGTIAGAEACDDGNTVTGDGCDDACAIEPGYTCTGEPSTCQGDCGDGTVVPTEKCDDGNTAAADGCDDTCVVEKGYTCTGMPSVCTTTCGDGVIGGLEACDDGNTNPDDGCDATCAEEPGWACAGEPSTCAKTCGDGNVDVGEECDDQNLALGDGCTDNCNVEKGFSCTGMPSVCTTTCGDGVIGGAETCDDSNTNAGDGCDASCLLEPGWLCTGEPTVCAPVCGDGVIRGMEGCDDSNTTPNDGCDAACGVEGGWTCTGEPSACSTVCGDGLIRGAETCDDQGTSSGDGCSNVCASEVGWTCTGEPSVCMTTCGDGVQAGAEQCDDGNTKSLDGCSATCVVDAFTESETNNTFGTANGPYTTEVVLSGSINPGTDADWYQIVLPATVDLHLETYDSSGPVSCLNIDTLVTLYAADGTTMIASDDDSGANACSRLSGATNAAMRHLPAGTYYVKVEESGNDKSIPGYKLFVTYDALCGNSTVEGAEECDGAAGCAATCDRIAQCGDSLVDAPETCDDGNTMDGDACSSSCQLSAVLETEPNENAMQATGPYAPIVLYQGAIQPATDVDFYAITLPATSDLTVESFDVNGPGSCNGIDTLLRLYDTDGTTVLMQRDLGGIGACGKIDSKKPADTAARHMPAGTYYVSVEDYLNNTVIPGYRLLVTLDATCGNGKVEGAEECDGGAGCSATCDRTAVCGDGNIDAPETCDDGNTTAGDGCSPTCTGEAVPETEFNGNSASANGPLAPYTLWSGAIAPLGDVDYFAITLTTTADITIETYDGTGPGSCAAPIDTVVTLLDKDGQTQLAQADDGGINTCSRLSSKTYAGARHLSPGTYYFDVEDFNNDTLIPGYQVEVRFDAVCGNGKLEGAEECDGGAGCSATCDRIEVCGDGFVDGMETCDDGNTLSGDGCSATCTAEATSEVEPNGTTAEADASPVILTGSGLVTGAIDVVGDQDVIRIDLAAASVLQLETLSGTGVGCGLTTTLTLLDAAGATIATDNVSGEQSCSALAMSLAAGTYYARVEEKGNDATIAAYTLRAKVLANGGPETEPNDQQAASDPVSNADTFVSAVHATYDDYDFFEITVPTGKSLRAEIIENGAETCTSGEMDSFLTLFDATGTEMGNDDDAGRGYCSYIDGLGGTPLHAFASKLPGGTYYLLVQAAPFSRAPGNASAVFDYRLAVTLR